MTKAIKIMLALSFCTVTLGLTSCIDTDILYETVTEADEVMYAMNRVALQKMNVGGEIAVVGHKGQDPDAVCSAISMAALMQQLGMPAKAYIQDKPIQAVKYIFDYTGFTAPEQKTSIEADQPLVLTDHNDYLQSLDGVDKANIVGVVDHHGISGSFTCPTPIYCKFMNVGSTSTIVYTIYKECGITPTKDIARLMVAGIIADTNSLTKATCTPADSIALNQLCGIAQYDDLSELTQGIDVALDSYIGMSDEEIFACDMKQYEIGGVTMAIASLDANEAMHIDELCQRMRGIMPVVQQQLGVQMLFAKIEEKFVHPDLLDADGNPTITYITHIPYYGEGAKELAEEVFGKTTHDNCVVLDRKLSRKTDIVPAITNALHAK